MGVSTESLTCRSTEFVCPVCETGFLNVILQKQNPKHYHCARCREVFTATWDLRHDKMQEVARAADGTRHKLTEKTF